MALPSLGIRSGLGFHRAWHGGDEQDMLHKLTNESTIDSTETKKGCHPRQGFPPRLAWQEIVTCHIYLSPAPRFRLGRRERAVIWKGRPASGKGTQTSVVDGEGREQCCLQLSSRLSYEPSPFLKAAWLQKAHLLSGFQHIDAAFRGCRSQLESP